MREFLVRIYNQFLHFTIVRLRSYLTVRDDAVEGCYRTNSEGDKQPLTLSTQNRAETQKSLGGAFLSGAITYERLICPLLFLFCKIYVHNRKFLVIYNLVINFIVKLLLYRPK